MRARPAYISSLGTTAILVAAALLMLAVVSAIVAFRGWPGAATGSGDVQSVPLSPNGTAARAALVRHVPKTHGVERSTRSRAGRPSRTQAVSTAGLVKEQASGPRVVPGVVMEPVAAAPMRPTGPGRTGGPDTQPATPTPAPQRPLPTQPNGPVGDGGGITIPLPV